MDPVKKGFCGSLAFKTKNCKYVFCALPATLAEARKLNSNSYFIHEGYSEADNFVIPDMDKLYDVSFIGGLRNERKNYISSLKGKFNFHHFTNVYGIDHSKAVAQSRVNLNFTEGGTSDRSYKVMASGGFLLTQPWSMMEKDFTPDIDLVCFNSIDEMLAMIDIYLTHPIARRDIEISGLNAVSRFDRTNFAKEICDAVFA